MDRYFSQSVLQIRAHNAALSQPAYLGTFQSSQELASPGLQTHCIISTCLNTVMSSSSYDSTAPVEEEAAVLSHISGVAMQPK